MIALLYTIDKVLESVLANCILYLVELHYYLPFTYTRDRMSSLTEYTIYQLVKNIYTTWNKRNMGLALFWILHVHLIIYHTKSYFTNFANKEIIRIW